MHYNRTFSPPRHIPQSRQWTIAAFYVVLLFVVGAFSIITGNFTFFHIPLIIGAIYVGLYPNVNTLIFFVLYTFAQNIFLICFSIGLTGSDMSRIILYKEMIVYLVSFIFLIRYGRGKFNSDNLSKILLISTALIFIYNIYSSNTPLTVKLLSLRQIMIPYVCLFFGYAMVLSIDKLKAFIKFFVMLVAITCVIGLWIYFQDTMTFWEGMNYPLYIFKKNGVLFNGVYDSFFSYDLGFMVKRFVSIFADAIAMAHMIGIALLFLFITCKNQYFLIKILVLSCAILCFSKSLVFLLCITLLVHFYLNIEDKNKRRVFTIVAVISLFGMFNIANNYVEGLEANTATGNHLKSLIYAVNNYSFLGNGLGSAGFVSLMTGNSVVAEATESFLAILITQIGVLGTVIFYSYFFVKINQLTNRYRKQKDKYTYLAIILLTDVILESIVSGSSIAMLGTGLYFIIPGMIYRNLQFNPRHPKQVRDLSYRNRRNTNI